MKISKRAARKLRQGVKQAQGDKKLLRWAQGEWMKKRMTSLTLLGTAKLIGVAAPKYGLTRKAWRRTFYGDDK